MAKVKTLRYTLLLISILSYFCNAQTTTNTIKAGQALRYSDKLLVSANGRFQLGFFNVSFSSTGFLGIRYTHKYNDDVVWVANRDAPINGLNATLAMDSDGLLKITRDGEGDPIPLNSNQTAPNATATLENSGNLVVRESIMSSNGSAVERVLWESFDYPTDTLLPGMKLGANLVTGKKWILSSWLSYENPGTGAFTLEYNHTGKDSQEAFVVRRRGNLFSRSGPELIGPWGKNQISYISTKEEIYFNFSGGNIINLGLQLNPDGRIRHVTTNVSSTYVSNCNGGLKIPYECAERGLPECRSGDGAFARLGRRVLNNDSASASYWADNNSSNVISDCFERCSSNCSCVGFNSLFSDETGCVFYGEGAQFEVSALTGVDYIFILNSTDEKSESGCNGSGKKWWIWFMISALAFVVLDL